MSPRLAAVAEQVEDRVLMSAPPIPELDRWETQMVEYGALHAKVLASGRGTWDDATLARTYYDQQHVFEEIAEVTGDPAWYVAADDAESAYRDFYVLPNDGNVPTYWIFSHGSLDDYRRTGDPASREAVVDLATNAAFARDTTNDADPNYPLAHYNQMREVARPLLSYLDAEQAGEPRRARLATLASYALGHLEQMFVSRTSSWAKPLYVAHTAEALIRYHEATGDSRVLPMLIAAADGMWDRLWDASAQAFRYSDVQIPGDELPTAAPDLNLFVAPLYAYLWKHTGEARFQQRGDAAFAGGVTGAYLTGSKQFNQNYYWSADYVNWRSSEPQSGGIQGSVFDDRNADRSRGSVEPGLAGRTVYLDLNNNGGRDPDEPQTSTTASGTFAFTNVAPREHVVRQVLPAGWRETSATGRAVTVNPGQTVQGVLFGATNKAAVRGTVFRDANGNGLRDSGEAGLSGFRVFLDADNDRLFDSNERSAVSDSWGYYGFEDLNAGSHVVRVAPVGGYTITQPSTGSHALSLSSGQVAGNRNFAAKPIA